MAVPIGKVLTANASIQPALAKLPPKMLEQRDQCKLFSVRAPPSRHVIDLGGYNSLVYAH